jgi:hypothetical protein
MRLLSEYVHYYHEDRTHLGLEKQTPADRKTKQLSDVGCSVVAMPRLDGLHHRYGRAA